MLVNEILLEAKPFAALVDAKKFILANCKPFLAKIKDKPLFRGERGNQLFSVNDIRVDRRPLDSEKSDTEFFNIAVKQVFGIDSIRNQALFMTGNYDEAGQYGTVNIVYPVGDFKFLASPDQDSAHLVGDAMRVFWSAVRSNGVKHVVNKKIGPRAFTIIIGGIEDDLESMIEKYNEVKETNAHELGHGLRPFLMASITKELHKFPIPVSKVDALATAIVAAILVEYLKRIKIFMMKFDTRHLAAHVQAKHEIMICDAKKYVGIRVDNLHARDNKQYLETMWGEEVSTNKADDYDGEEMGPLVHRWIMEDA